MDEDVGRGEVGGQEFFLSFIVVFGEIVQVHVSQGFWSDNKKIAKTQKKSKRSKEELQHVLDYKSGATRRNPRSLQKRNNTFEVGEGSKQQSNNQSHERTLNLKKSCAKY